MASMPTVIGPPLRFQDRGRDALKGLPAQWQLFAAVGDGDRSNLVPLPTSTPEGP
jgi:hypothetical protein